MESRSLMWKHSCKK